MFVSQKLATQNNLLAILDHTGGCETPSSLHGCRHSDPGLEEVFGAPVHQG
jgi:hypothetical protein